MAEGDFPDDGINDPFAAMPFLGDMMKALSGQGPLNWEAARQFAQLGATGGESEPNVDPLLRPAYEDLSRIAALHVADLIGVDQISPGIELMTRSQWAHRTLEDYRPLFTELASSLGGVGSSPSGPLGSEVAASDPLSQMLSGLNQMMAPAMLGMTVGSMVGTMAQRVFGIHDLPIPRPRPTLLLVSHTIEEFAQQSSIDTNEMRLWVLAHEMAGSAVMSAPHLSARLTELIRAHVGAFRPDPNALSERLNGLDLADGDPMAAMQQAFSDPGLLLGAVLSAEQRAMAPTLDAAVAAVVGVTDWVVDAIAARLIGGNALTIAEAVRRRRLEATQEEVFVEQLLGVRVGSDQVARGKAFAQGVVDRVGESGISLLVNTPDSMPTASEIDAPGLWLARVTGE
jgi:putative hydrolase